MIGIGLAINKGGLPAAFAELNLLSAALDPRITFTRASTKTYIGADGLLHTAAANEWPLEYDPATLLPVGRTPWEARTNLILDSGNASTANWTTLGSAATSDLGVYAPLADVSMHKVEVASGGATWHGKAQVLNLPASGKVSITLFVQKGTSGISYFEIKEMANNNATASMDIFTKAVGTTSSSGVISSQLTLLSRTLLADGVTYRVELAFVSSATGGNTQFLVAPGTSTVGQTIIQLGMQVEQASNASPYIPTNGATATRAADVATVNDLSTLRFNPSEGTWYVEYTPGNTNAGVLSTAPVAAGGYLAITQDGTGTGWYAGPLPGMGNAAVGGQNKTALAYAPGGAMAGSRNGNAAVAVSSGSDYTGGSTSLRLGDAHATPSHLNGPIKRIRYYPRAYAAAQLEAMTAL